MAPTQSASQVIVPAPEHFNAHTEPEDPDRFDRAYDFGVDTV